MLSVHVSTMLANFQTLKMKRVIPTRTLLLTYMLIVSSSAHYMNQWAVEVAGGSNEEAEEIAKDAGCENKGKLLNGPIFT